MTSTNQLQLTRKEKDLLDCLRRNSGECVTRERLLQEVWGYREGVKSRTLDVHVQRLRRKLGPEKGAQLRTVFRSGYLWSPRDMADSYPMPSVSIGANAAVRSASL